MDDLVIGDPGVNAVQPVKVWRAGIERVSPRSMVVLYVPARQPKQLNVGRNNVQVSHFKCYYRSSLSNCSLPQYYFSYILTIFTENTQTWQMITIDNNERKKSEFSSMTHNYHLFIHWKFTRPNIIQRNIILKNINLLLFNRNSKHLAQYLNFIIWVLSCLPQCKVTITVYCLIFGCVSKPHKLKMHFSEIFINIKLLSWMWCKDNFGLSIKFLLFTRFSVKS